MASVSVTQACTTFLALSASLPLSRRISSTEPCFSCVLRPSSSLLSASGFASVRDFASATSLARAVSAIATRACRAASCDCAAVIDSSRASDIGAAARPPGESGARNGGRSEEKCQVSRPVTGGEDKWGGRNFFIRLILG